jgi:VWFA-related protein
VFSGSAFIDNLTRDDFEVLEDGVPQEILAMYMINKADIIKREETRNFMPFTPRIFYLAFNMIDYNDNIGKAMDHFFKEVLQPQDSLIVITPEKPYILSSKVLESRPREEIAKELKKIIRKDVNTASSIYKSAITKLKRVAASISTFSGGWESFDSIEMGDPVAEGRSSSLGNLLKQYRMRLEELEATRGVKGKKLLDFANQLKQQRGQKNVFYFYQKEYIPMLSTMNLQRLYNLNEDNFNIQSDLNDLMQMYSREKGLSSDRLSQAFGDASIIFNLIFVDQAKDQNMSGGIVMQEQSADVYEALSKAAKASGGLVEATKNAALAFKRILEMTELYYLLYYSPKNYKKDGKFRKIEVRLKNKDYKVDYRYGYIG